MLDIARDPRWGRIAEGSGEDTYLDARMGEAMVRGYQGNLADSTSMAACIKHFVGYGAAEGGRDYNSTYLTERQLRNVYLPPFEAAVKAGALTLMTSFNDNDGVPSTGNTFVVKDILRGEWGFDGLVVTDWNSMGEMIAHGFGEDRKDVAEKAVKAGVDMDMMTYGFLSHLEELAKDGAVKEKAIDQAVRNILRVKVMLGLFEHPYVDVAAGRAVQYAPEHLAAAQKTAEESAILLKNAGVLPLKAGVRMLVTGPLADAPHDQLGTWSFDGEKEHTVTPLKALQARFPGQVTYVPGLRFSREKRERFDDVLAAARHADVVLAFVGAAKHRQTGGGRGDGRPSAYHRARPSSLRRPAVQFPSRNHGRPCAGQSPLWRRGAVGQNPRYVPAYGGPGPHVLQPQHDRTPVYRRSAAGRYSAGSGTNLAGKHVLLPGLWRLSALPLRLWP